MPLNPLVFQKSHGIKNHLLLQLINGSDLLAAAKDAKVELILAGHTHIPKVYNVSDVNIICAGTAISFGKREEAHSFYTITLDIGGAPYFRKSK